jgi:3-dehydroquinate synthase
MEPVRLDVATPSRPYTVTIADGALEGLARVLDDVRAPTRRFVVSSPLVWRLHGPQLAKALNGTGPAPEPILVPDGERYKHLQTVTRIYDALVTAKADRASTLITFGGGVIGDMAGFAAATYLRGIALVHVPTTLLAQVDSSVGGKVGVNLAAGKNLVGAFYQPRLVLCDLETLDTLPEREFRAGLAEVIKYGIIYDAALFSRLERDMPKLLRREPKVLAEAIARCCEIKSEVVGKDEKESGLRAILNFGHTIGHALEAISHYGKYLHGEAISIGQAAAAVLSARLLGSPEADVARIIALFEAAGLPTKVDLSMVQRRNLFSAMALDKKVSDGEIKFVLARRIGQVEFGQRVPKAAIEAVLKAK